MEESKKNKKKYSLIIWGVIGAILLTLGITYAYWRLTKEQTGENVVNTDCFNIEFTGENDIALDKAYPLDDAELESFLSSAIPYHFTITNRCSSLASATINLESLNAGSAKQLDDEWIDAILYETDYHKKLNKSTKLTGNPNNDANKVIADALHAYSLKNFTLKANEVKDYYLLLYMDQETPLREDTQNATWKGKITLSAEYAGENSGIGTLRIIDEYEENGLWKYKEYITELTLEDKMSNKQTSDGQILYGPFDESENKDDGVKSYVICNKEITDEYMWEEEEFELPKCTGYIQSNGGIKANMDSSYLFANFSNLLKINNLNILDTSETTNMTGMFTGISNIDEELEEVSNMQELDLSNFDTGQVENMSYMFYNAKIENIKFPQNFGESATDMSGMFNFFYSNTLDLNNFDISKVINMSEMFKMANIENIKFPQNFGESAIDMSEMFSAYRANITLDLSNFNTSKVENMSKMFGTWNEEAENNINQIIFPENFDTSNVTDMSYMFDTSKLTTLDLSKWDTSQVIDMSHMFSYMRDLQELDLSGWNTSQVKNMYCMFAYASGDIIFPQNFGESATNMSWMFQDYVGNKLDLTNFNTKNVTTMECMFDYATLTSLSLESFNTSQVKNMRLMFGQMKQIQELDLSNFNTTNVTSMEEMFLNSTSLTTITYGSNFIHNSGADVRNMFNNCTANKPNGSVHSSWEGVF